MTVTPPYNGVTAMQGSLLVHSWAWVTRQQILLVLTGSPPDRLSS